MSAIIINEEKRPSANAYLAWESVFFFFTLISMELKRGFYMIIVC
jgi:hypothetical protein